MARTTCAERIDGRVSNACWAPGSSAYTTELGETWREDPAAFEAATPLLRVTPGAPDFLVLHGVRDSLVPIEQARLFVARLRETSLRSVVYAELPGAQHAFDVLPSIRSAHVVRAIDRYLHWHWNGWRRERLTAG